jgi:hypothetical protein
VFELFALNIVQFIVCPLVFRFPLVSVIDDVDNHVVDNVQPPPTPLNVTTAACRVTPLVSIVLPVVVAKKLTAAVPPVPAVNATFELAFVQLP